MIRKRIPIDIFIEDSGRGVVCASSACTIDIKIGQHAADDQMGNSAQLVAGLVNKLNCVLIHQPIVKIYLGQS